MIKMAFAVGHCGEFGTELGLPWGKPIKVDMEAFKNFTAGCRLVMGRRTFESLPTKLRDLDHIVFSSKPKNEIYCKDGTNPTLVLSGSSVDLLKGLNALSGNPLCVIGGAELIEELAGADIIDQVLCTSIYDESRHPNGRFVANTFLDIHYINDCLLENFNFCKSSHYKNIDGSDLTIDISIYKNI